MFTNRVRLVVLSCVLALAPVLLLSTPAIAAGQQMRKASGMLFQQRVEAYVALHRQCAQRLSLRGVDPQARAAARCFGRHWPIRFGQPGAMHYRATSSAEPSHRGFCSSSVPTWRRASRWIDRPSSPKRRARCRCASTISIRLASPSSRCHRCCSFGCRRCPLKSSIDS